MATDIVSALTFLRQCAMKLRFRRFPCSKRMSANKVSSGALNFGTGKLIRIQSMLTRRNATYVSRQVFLCNMSLYIQYRKKLKHTLHFLIK